MGRLTVVVTALVTIGISAVLGWLWGVNLDSSQYGFSQSLTLTPNRVIFAAFGFIIGAIGAGSLFGFLAAIFDMQRSLRTLVET